jgi:hypothetical protein
MLQFSYAVDYPVDGVKSHFSCSPLLYLEYQLLSKFRDYNTKVLLRRHLYTEFIRTKREVHKTLSHQSDLLRLHNVVLTVMLFVLFCTLYRI